MMHFFLTILLAVTVWSDSLMFDAYRHENMAVWKEYVDTQTDLLYEYGYCGYIVAEAKKSGDEAQLEEAKRYVQRFKAHVESAKAGLPAGHYQMFLSAVYVFELRLHLSIHPMRSMSLAKEATRLAPEDPLVLSYYGTCLFYAPKPFGSKAEALEWFERAKPLFETDAYRFSWH